MATGANAEAIEAWDGPLFERFVQFRHIIVTGLALHGEKALALYPPPPGAAALDVGCGFGDTTAGIARLVGPEGRAHGVDVAPRFIESATAEFGSDNASFSVADVQFDDLGGPYDYVFSRFGVMFFDNPGAAMRNIRRSMAPGGRLVAVVWRIREDNPWIYEAQQIVERLIGRPEEYDEPTCGPGPFSMAGADTTSGILVGAGFTDVSLTRCDLPILIGRDVDEAVEMVMALGPAGEMVRLWGERMAHRHAEIRDALADGLSNLQTDNGIEGMASTWIVSAVNPAD
ncbi:MAG TPA: class I SAM-dependent methyltransferase [Thermoleophilaceae bacterium]|jgi:ubiquinone/menaquinone biosynthesis C-methylase UbiE|nr:class I SAM-dependent methyltransferase [Thermoleophilaceae bacterium]